MVSAAHLDFACSTVDYMFNTMGPKVNGRGHQHESPKPHSTREIGLYLALSNRVSIDHPLWGQVCLSEGVKTYEPDLF